MLAEGKDLAEVRARVRPQLRAELTAAAARLERSGLRSWEIGTLPREVTLTGTGQAVRAYPALVDEGETAGVAVLENAVAQRTAMRAGTRRLLRLTIPAPRPQLGNAAVLALSTAPHGSLDAVLDDALTAALDALIDEAGGPAWDEAAFARLRDHVAGHLAERTSEIVGRVVRVLDAAREVESRLEPLTAIPLQPARADVREQLRRLVHPGLATRGRLEDVERYLQGAARRLERLPDNPAVDRDRMNAIHELERLYRERLRERPADPSLREVPWLLEELRVSQFAQGLGARGNISTKRIRRVLDEATTRN